MERVSLKRKAEGEAEIIENVPEEAQNLQQHSQPSEVVETSASPNSLNHFYLLVESLQNILICLQTHDENDLSTFVNKLSASVHDFVDTEYRTLPAHALDILSREKTGKSPEAVELAKIFTDVKDAFVSLARKLQNLEPQSFEQYRIFRDQKEEITAHKESIQAHKELLTNGNFFLPLEEVWTQVEKDYDGTEIDANFFNRNHHVSTYLKDATDERYEKTVVGALRNDCIAAIKSASAKDSSQTGVQNKVDIFGHADNTVQSAHLIPQSTKCSGRWFPVVPMVLNLSNEQQKKWLVLQRCIHGCIHPTKGTSVDSTSGKLKREPHVGIKHFTTNRVRLEHHTRYIDEDPCILIVPIMEDEEIRKWSGDGYSAIVLAGRGTSNTASKVVYESVGASRGGYKGDFLATEEEVNTARSLLEKVLRCLSKSFQDLSTNVDFVKDAKGDETFWSLIDAKDFFTMLTSETSKIKFPGRLDFETIKSKFVKVRKVCFAERCKSHSTKTIESAVLHPAPDPMLLLLKAASNWLRQQYLYLLPACGPLDTDEEGDDDDDQSSYTITSEVEGKLRGWSVDKEPSEISCNGAVIVSHDEASLTDEYD